MKTIFEKKFYIYLIIIILIGLILPFFVVSLYAFPTKDDFCNILVNSHVSIFQRLIFVYTEWSGRYIPAMLGFVGKYIIGTSYGYALFLFVCMALQVFAIYKLIAKLFNNKKLVVFASLLISLVFYSTLPELGEGLYWFTSVKVYSLGIIFSTLYISQVIRLIHVTKVSQLRFLYIIMLAVCSVGTNETTALLLVLFHIVLHFLYKQQYGIQLQIIMVVLVCFLLLSFCAPGNFERTIYIPKASYVVLLRNALFYTCYYAVTWCIHPVFLSFICITFFLGRYFQKMIIQLPHIIYVIIIIGAIPAAGVFASMFGVGEISSLRMLNPAYLFFILSVGLVSYTFGCKSRIFEEKFVRKLILPLFVVFVLCCVGFSNVTIIGKDFIYNRFRDFSMYNSKIIAERKLPKPILPTQIPHTFTYYDNPSHSNQWSLNCMKKVYRLE